MSTEVTFGLDEPAVIPNAADRTAVQSSALAEELRLRQDAILVAWRAAERGDQDQNLSSSLSVTQFNDHIPAVLECLASTLQGATGHDSRRGDRKAEAVCEHGLQRWQQGYQLREVIREWGSLQMCVAEELERYAELHPDLEPGVMPAARRVWTRLCADGVTESATQYWRLHQAESAGHVTDLEQALSALHNLEQARAEAWRTAAHDLRGTVTVVKGATTLLNEAPDMPEPERAEVADMLTTGVAALHDMLNDLLDLARLEAGHEQRQLAPFDAATLMRDFCTAAQPAAASRGLFLKTEGPESLLVVGDNTQVLRILQNLMLNAMKYTQHGGVSVTWGLDKTRDTDRWTFSVQDTGPGIDDTDAAPLAQELLNATEVANDVREASKDRRREIAPATTLPSASKALPKNQQAGEGVGLTIVKRLCELLDASLELATEPGHGSTFRVILPCKY